MASTKPVFLRSTATVINTYQGNQAEAFGFPGYVSGKIRAIALVTANLGNFPVSAVSRGVFDILGFYSIGLGPIGGIRIGKFDFNAPVGHLQQISIEFTDPFFIFESTNLQFQVNLCTLLPGDSSVDYAYLVVEE